MKPPTATSNNSFAKATASSQNRSKSPAFTPAIAPKKHQQKTGTVGGESAASSGNIAL